MKKLILPLFLIGTLLSGCTGKSAVADYRVVPLPQDVVLSDEASFTLTTNTSIVCSGDEVMQRNARLLDEVMNQAHHLNILLRILACSSSRLLRLECRNLLLPKPEGMFGYPNFCGHLTNRIVKFQILLHRLSQTPYRDSPPGVPSRRIARHQDP